MTTLVVKVGHHRFIVIVSGDPAPVLAAYARAGLTAEVMQGGDQDAA
jgi:hypothetical protein